MKVVRVGAQALSVALVAGLLALLVWKVAHQFGDATIASEVHKGKEPATPAFALPRLSGGTLASDVAARQGAGGELLGVVVHPVPR